MKKHLINLAPLLLVFLFSNLLQAQIFNFDYFLSDQTFSTQTSLVACDDGSALSVHNKAEVGIIADVASRDILINRVDMSGNILFTKKYGSRNLNERGNSVAKTADGGFIVVGTQLHPDFRSNGVLAFKVNAAGVIQWQYWYGLPETRLGGEAFAIVNVDDDQFLIAGTANQSRDLIALLIKENGGYIWGKRYSTFSISTVAGVSRVVTDLIEDQVLDGYIIAGTHYEGAINPNNKSSLFTFAIDLNGAISRPYAKHQVAGWSLFNPSMTPAFAEGNFALTCGARNGITDGLPSSYTVAMELDDNLDARWTAFYSSPGTVNQHGHSIYRNDEGDRYAIGCQYQGLFPNLLNNRNTAFLSITSTGTPIGLIRYKRDRDQLSTYMAYDEVNENFLIKSDNKVNNNFSLGLIRTTLSGRARCARTEAVNAFRVATTKISQRSATSNYADFYRTRLPVVEMELRPDQCFFESAEAMVSNPNDGNVKSSLLAAGEVKVYPTLLSQSSSDLTVEIQLEAASQATIKVYDTLGRLVLEQSELANAGFTQIQLDGRSLPEGINLISISTADEQLNETVKIVKK